MACKAYTLRGLNNLCKSPSFGGIKEVLIAHYDDIASLSVDSGTSLLTIVMKEGKQFYEYKLMKNTGSLTSTLNTSETAASYFTNEVYMQFFKMETVKRIEIMALMMNASAVIVRDANNHYWFLGYDNYVECTAGTAGTGVNASDPNRYELTLSDDSHELPFEVDPSIIESLLQPATPPVPPIGDTFITFTANANSTVKLFAIAPGHNVQYSLDGNTWVNEIESTVHSLNTGDKIYYRGVMTDIFEDDLFTHFSIGGDVSVSGNANYFWNYEHPESAVTSYCGHRMFDECTGLTDASELVLPATTLAENCYDSMFWGCTNLTAAPELPATTLNTMCYAYMFYECSSLTTAPELPALSLPAGCYQEMFQNCSSLNYVKCMAINFELPQPDATDSWLDGVAATGTFVKNINMTEWTLNSGNGIPEGWTIQNATIDGNTEIIE